MTEAELQEHQELVDRVMDVKFPGAEGALRSLQQAGIVDENGELTELYAD